MNLVNAWTYSVMVLFHLPYILCTFSSEICDTKSLLNIVSFTKYSHTKGMHKSLLSHESSTRIDARKAETVRRPKEDCNLSNLPAPGHLMHVNMAELSDALRGAPIIPESG